ncbi:hypothetical protein OsI_34424 [Oryza sativa Indica Group]|uniref:Glutathione S-transferase n=1 Tax=Oryza sativa subsp. indica TaxID=39946 RepID=A2Z9L4_ORYSI|nr:hypothetical protein OsI_34424 [Oryza sativa Indica Group]
MAGHDELKLLGTWASPYVSRVKLALHLKGLSYEYVVEEDHFNNKSELLLSSNQLVPSWKQAFSGKTGEEKAEGMRHMLAAVDALEAAMEEWSKGKPFFGGDAVGFLDVALGGLLSWLHGTEELCGAKILDAAKTPLLSAWARRFGEMDAAKVALPDVCKLVEFAKMRRVQLEAAMAATTVSRN